MLSNNKFHSSRGTVKEKGCSGNHSYLAQRSLKIAWNQSSNYRNQFLQLHITRLTPQLSLLSSAVRSLIRNVNRLDDLFSREKKSVGQVKNFTHTHTHTHTHPHTHTRICCCSVSKPCPTLCDSMDCSHTGSFVHGVLQAGILERVTISFCSQQLWGQLQWDPILRLN